MDTVRVGIIGCGGMARTLAAKCIGSGRASIVAVADPSAEAVAQATAAFGCEAAPDVDALCSREDIDAVIVASPPGLHHPHVLAAAAAGKEVYCEKPLAITVAECDEMISACASAGVGLFVGQVLRLFPLFWHSRTILDEGRIGKARAVSVTRTGYSPVFHAGWRTRRDLSGSLLHEVSVHELDYQRFLLGEPVEVYARMANLLGKTEYDDQAFVLVTFEGGRHGLLHANAVSPTGEYRVQIVADGGSMVHGGLGGALTWKAIDGGGGSVTPEQVGVPDPYEREVVSWLDAITKGVEPLFTGADGRAAVAMAQAALESATSGQPVRIADL
ncbi:MAG TPA: Gfo/Idh/MocA family oxidoreductase [Chthonomonadales bacterium]|nr:Gfo/Idh/MocA family oxidoreductase [Chthonomonadales bacterium]